MKTLSNKSANNLYNTAIKLPVFFLLTFLAFFTGAVGAQSINDGLQPKKPVVKPPRVPRGPRVPKIIKPPVKPPVKRQPVRNVVPVNTVPAVNPPVISTPTPQPVAPVKPQPVAPPEAPPEAPEETLKRFIDFQQSGSVTVKDWENVVAQTQNNPNDSQAKAQHFIAQGYLAYNRGDHSSALVQFKAAALEMPDSALPLYSIGRVYLITKQPNQAENHFEKAIKLNKKFALAYQGMGDALTAQKKNKKAQDYYDDAARIAASESSTGGAATSGGGGNGIGASDRPADPTTLSADSAYALELTSAKELTKRKKWQGSLDKLLPLAKSNPTADLYIAIGDNYFGMEQWLSAQQTYEKATVLNPNSALAFYKSGLVLFETNEFQAAADAFEKSLILDQTGLTINRERVRKMANEAGEKASDMKGKDKRKKFFVM